MDVAEQVTYEENRPGLIRLFGAAQALHTNFYEDWLSSDTVSIYLEDMKKLLPELERIRGVAPPEFNPETRDQRNRRRRLTRGRRQAWLHKQAFAALEAPSGFDA